MKRILLTAIALCAATAWAKLPPPSDEAKAKAAETAAKTAYNGKLEAFQLCKAQDKIASKVNKSKTKATTPPCADPGKFVYPPPATAAAPAPAAPGAKIAAAPAAPAVKK